MRLPLFDYVEPDDLAGALKLMADSNDDAVFLAGGTDLLVRMKQHLIRPGMVVSLKRLTSLANITHENEVVRIGARASLADLIVSPLIRNYYPGLIQAIAAIGAPSIQHHRGTIGGNILQDNRCQYYNQSWFWRSTRQACHKEGGTICYAREGSDRCNSTCQSDTAPALAALNAHVTIADINGTRTIPILDIYSMDGAKPFVLSPREILLEIILPTPVNGMRSAYRRTAYRSAIDYPIVSAGVCLTQSDAMITSSRIVLGAVGRAPLFLAQASEMLTGKSLTDSRAFREAGDCAMDTAITFAADNVGSPLEYRSRMASVLVRQALEEAAGTAGSCVEKEREAIS